MKKRERSLKEAIESLGEALEELTAHSKTADDGVRNSFADLRLDVDRREREVLEELRKTKERKETELLQQKAELEVFSPASGYLRSSPRSSWLMAPRWKSP